jgi:hypothetical protein
MEASNEAIRLFGMSKYNIVTFQLKIAGTDFDVPRHDHWDLIQDRDVLAVSRHQRYLLVRSKQTTRPSSRLEGTVKFFCCNSYHWKGGGNRVR